MSVMPVDDQPGIFAWVCDCCGDADSVLTYVIGRYPGRVNHRPTAELPLRVLSKTNARIGNGRPRPEPIFAAETAACPRFDIPMQLARTVPDARGFELRSFECTSCDHSGDWLHKDAS